METIIKRRYFPSICYGGLEKWLEKMGADGYELIDYGKLKYVFKKSAKTGRKYFVYDSFGTFRADGGYYSISLRYPLLAEQYGVAPKKSILNKKYTVSALQKRKITLKSVFTGSSKTIVEIDPEKADAGFAELIAERNRLYKRRTLKYALIVLLIIAGYIAIALLK